MAVAGAATFGICSIPMILLIRDITQIINFVITSVDKFSGKKGEQE